MFATALGRISSSKGIHKLQYMMVCPVVGVRPLIFPTMYTSSVFIDAVI